jgi:pimeloyl-ACP methyl ester carboxylesterase
VFIKQRKEIFLKSGNKSTVVVFLHGWGMYKETWKNLFPELSKYYTIYALDLPGFGDNQDIPTKFILEEYVKLLNDFLEQNNIKSCVLVGHSFGANVAALFTVTHPKKVEKLVLYSGGVSLNNKLNRPMIYREFITYSLILFSVIVRWIRNKKISLHDYSKLKTLYNNTHGGNEIVGKAKLIYQPVLLIAGRYDFLAPLSSFRKLRKLLPNAQLIIFNRSSHSAHMEEKKKFLVILENFIGYKNYRSISEHTVYWRNEAKMGRYQKDTKKRSPQM